MRYTYVYHISQHFVLKTMSVDNLRTIPVPEPRVPDARGVSLINLYNAKCYVREANAILGSPFSEKKLLPMENYDGKLFQLLYLDFKEGKSDLEKVIGEKGLGERPLELKRIVKKKE